MTEKVKLETMVKYIDRHSVDMTHSEKQDILQMIINARIDDKKIQTKGNGTLIKYSDIPLATINNIYNYIKSKLENKINALQYFPDKEEK